VKGQSTSTGHERPWDAASGRAKACRALCRVAPTVLERGCQQKARRIHMGQRLDHEDGRMGHADDGRYEAAVPPWLALSR